MSDPAGPVQLRSASPIEATDAPGTEARRRRVRWMDTAITLLLALSAGGVLLVATPPLLRAAGFGSTPRSDASVRRPMRTTEEPQFFEGDEELADPRDPHGLRPPRGDDEDETDKRSPLRMGRVERPVKLFDQPGGGEAVGELRSGATVMLVRDQGDWVLVVHNGDRDISMGWTRRSDIAVR
jgi:hypothetical protein